MDGREWMGAMLAKSENMNCVTFPGAKVDELLEATRALDYRRLWRLARGAVYG
jgi:hypothetical protein